MSQTKTRDHFRCQWFYLFWLFTIIPIQVMASGTKSVEHKLKAALTYKVAKFVEWPGQVSAKSHNTFGICLLGEDYFGPVLDALQDHMVGGLPISIQRFSQSTSIDDSCQVVFVSRSKQVFLESIFKILRQRSILTIGDTKRFAERGGMIQFIYNNRHIGFKINLKSAKRTGLKIAAPLLEMASMMK